MGFTQTTRRGRPPGSRSVRARHAAGDLLRLAGAFVGLNAAKSWARLRRRRCRCQNPSDSGRGGETGCDAVAPWHDPARFRRVCPLLQPYPGRGWRCSVDRASVRPFWGRALAVYGLLALALALTAITGLGIVWRDQGVRIVDLAWPPHWPRIRSIRSQAFVSQARAALARRDLAAAVVCLRSACAVDPANGNSRRALAQLLQISRPVESDGLYRQLLAADPATAEAAAQAWLPALLARGEFEAVGGLAAARLRAGAPGAGGGWLRVLLLAGSLTGEDAEASRLLAAPRLAAETKSTLTLAQELRDQGASEARRLLLHAASTATSPIEVYFICRWLAERGFGDEALGVLDAHRSRISDRDYVALRFAALVAAGEAARLRSEAAALLAADPSAALVDLLSAHLLRHPDRALLQSVLAAIENRRRAPDNADCASLVALFCVCARAGETAAMNDIRSRIAAAAGVPFSAGAAVAPFLDGSRPATPVRAWLPLLQPLSPDVTYALLESVRPPAAPSAVRPAARPRS